MSADTPGTLARRWFATVWNERDREAIYKLMAPDCGGLMEGDTPVRGPDDFAAAFDMLVEMFPDLQVHVDEAIEQGDQAAVRWRFEGTHRGDGMGCAPTGCRVAFRGMTWIVVREGKIVCGWDSWNQGALLESLRAAAVRD